MIALTIQLMIEPARRALRRRHPRAPGRSCSAPPERWAVTTRSLVWAQLDVLVPAFTGASDRRACRSRAATTSRWRQPSTSTRSPTARRRWRSTSTGSSTTASERGGLQMVLVPWIALDRLPHAGRRSWRETIEHYYPNTGWVAAARGDARARSSASASRAGLATLDACLEALLEEVAVPDAARAAHRVAALRGLRAVPVHARERPRTRRRRRSGSCTRRPTRPARRATFDHLELRVRRCEAPPEARAERRGRASCRRAASATRRRARRVELPASPLAQLARSAERAGDVRRTAPCTLSSRSRPRARGRAAATCRAAASTTRRACPRGARPRARRCAARCSRRTRSCACRRGRFVSPLESPRATASTPSRCSRRRGRRACSAPRSCCPTTRSSRPRAAAACSTRPRSRRRCCCTCMALSDAERDADRARRTRP